MKLGQSFIRRFFRAMGPGFIAGSAGDDPSGIATYSIAGAQFGTTFLWVSWFSWPLMGAIQMMCARIGMVTGQGLAVSLNKKFPKWVVLIFCFGVLIANTINIAADLSGMADAAKLVTGLPSSLYVVVFGVGIVIAIIKCHYDQIANILKWLALSLLAYIVTAFLTHPDWSAIAGATFSLHLPKGNEGIQMIVAILGTTISPYLFFWQSAQEIEEERKKGHTTLASRRGASQTSLTDRIMDVSAGTFFSNLVMFFIILTTALTLNKSGHTHIETSKEAAEALKPLAGNLATMLYSIGLITVGLLAIPTLAGSTAYAFSEILGFNHGLNKKLRQAKLFYGIIVLSTLIGIGIDFIGINPMKALVWSAVVNGVISPFILVGVIWIASDRKLMQNQPSSWLNIAVVGFVTILMFAAAFAMIVLPG